MSEFGVDSQNEHEKRKNAAVALIRRVNDILLEHPRTLSLDIHELQRSELDKNDPRQDELIRMSAKNHLNCLAAFYKRQYPDVKMIRIDAGVHSALALHDAITNNNMMLLATTLLLPDDRSLQAIGVTVRDEYVLASSTVYMADDGTFEAMNDVKARDDGLVKEALELVDVGRRDLVIPLLSGAVHALEVDRCLDELRDIVASQYDENETDRFLRAVENRYYQKRRADETASELGVAGMASSEMEELLTVLEPVDDWA